MQSLKKNVRGYCWEQWLYQHRGLGKPADLQKMDSSAPLHVSQSEFPGMG